MRNKKLISLTALGVLLLGSVSGSLLANKISKEPAIAFATYTNHDADTYYNSIDESKSGNDLLVDLRELNLKKRKSTVGYDNMGTSPSGQFKYTDYDPNFVQYDSNGQPYGTKISSFYTYTSATSWNREHVWPNSHGGGKKGDTGTPYPDADIHMPRPTISSENSSRGNSFFVEGMNHSANGWDPYTAGYSKDSRGEAARITFYCTLVNAKLILASTNLTPSGNDPITGKAYGSGHTMGNLITLLKWNINHPVTQREKNRNEGAEYLQGNRNPFVDHPEYACRIWGEHNDETRSICASINKGINLSKTSIELMESKTETISATSSDNSSISWTVDNPSVVSLGSTISGSGTSITLTALNPGSAIVTAKATIGGEDYSKSCIVTVTAMPVSELSSISLSGTYKTKFALGDSFSSEGLVVTANYSSGPSRVLSSDEYTLTEPDMSTAGNKVVSISYTENGITRGTAYSISVVKDELSSISLSGGKREFEVGDTFDYESLVVTAHYTVSSDKVVTPSSVSSPDMSTSGTKEVTVTYIENNISKSAIYQIVVNEPVVHVTSVSLNKETLELKEGEQSTLVATVLPENAANKGVSWSSSDSTIASVSDGVVTAVKEGTATITVTTIDGGLTATCEVTVSKVPELEPSKGGCGGNVITTSAILSTLSILGIGLLLIKRKFSK